MNRRSDSDTLSDGCLEEWYNVMAVGTLPKPLKVNNRFDGDNDAVSRELTEPDGSTHTTLDSYKVTSDG